MQAQQSVTTNTQILTRLTGKIRQGEYFYKIRIISHDLCIRGFNCLANGWNSQSHRPNAKQEDDCSSPKRKAVAQVPVDPTSSQRRNDQAERLDRLAPTIHDSLIFWSGHAREQAA